jgi:hypothetical protein
MEEKDQVTCTFFDLTNSRSSRAVAALSLCCEPSAAAGSTVNHG